MCVSGCEHVAGTRPVAWAGTVTRVELQGSVGTAEAR